MWIIITAVYSLCPPALCQSLRWGLYRMPVAEVGLYRLCATRCRWIITGVNFLIAVDCVLLRPREVSVQMGLASVAIIFSLAGIRASQPGIPSMGCVIDMAGYFWNVLMVRVDDEGPHAEDARVGGEGPGGGEDRGSGAIPYIFFRTGGGWVGLRLRGGGSFFLVYEESCEQVR